MNKLIPLLASTFLLLSVGASHAQGVFKYVNPWECVSQAKSSTLPKMEIRHDLSDCMAKGQDPTQAARVLEASGFGVFGYVQREIDSFYRSGHHEEAWARLRQLILTGE